APDVPHALHMPSHIYLLLGMWPEVTKTNEAAWSASVRWASEKGLGPDLLDYHVYHWLIYGLLQQGRYREALACAENFRRLKSRMPVNALTYYDRAVAALIVETRHWEL